MSNSPVSALWNLIRLIEARLQAVSSRNMYSLHGLLALIRPSFGQVCHSLMVESYWRPGSAHDQAALQMSSQRSLALRVFMTLSPVRLVRFQSWSSSTALKNSLETLTELFEFWPETVMYASDS